jgi:hypothetical protein
LVWVGLTLPLILGMSGLGVDATLWYMDRRVVQTVADAGAIAGAHVVAQPSATIQSTVASEAARNNFMAGGAKLITVNAPPLNGPNAADNGFVEVIVSRQRTLLFSRFFKSEPTMIAARSVAGVVSSGSHCVLGLDETMDAAVEFSGTADANISCGVAANSSSDRAISITGNASLTADPAQAYGDIYVAGNGELVTEHPIQSFSSRIPDPYGPDGRDLQVPVTPVACAPTGPAFSGTVTLDPDRYCGGLKFTNADVTFNPGVYILDAGDFEVGGTSTLNGVGVTFIFTATAAADIGNLKLTGGTEATLIAPGPGSGLFAGVLFYQDQRALSFQGSNLIDNKSQGGSLTDMRGAMYFPNQEIVFTGGADTGDGCLQLVGRKVTFTGNGTIANTEQACIDQGVESMAQLRVRLTE